jgi:hypothetical protein
MLTTTQVKAWICCKDPEEMHHFFDLKHEETAEKWRIEDRHEAPPLLTVPLPIRVSLLISSMQKDG